MIDLKAIHLTFTIEVKENNIHILRRLFHDSDLLNISDESEIQLGGEIELVFSFEGELQKEVVAMAMLFNSDLVGKPKLTLTRE